MTARKVNDNFIFTFANSPNMIKKNSRKPAQSWECSQRLASLVQLSQRKAFRRADKRHHHPVFQESSAASSTSPFLFTGGLRRQISNTRPFLQASDTRVGDCQCHFCRPSHRRTSGQSDLGVEFSPIGGNSSILHWQGTSLSSRTNTRIRWRIHSMSEPRCLNLCMTYLEFTANGLAFQY